MKDILVQTDLETSSATFFNFDTYSEALVKIITNTKTKTPLSIGIFGDWGTGKSSLMLTVEKEIKDNYNDITSIWFNAWKYDKEEAIWRTLLMRILEELKSELKLELKKELKKEPERITSTPKVSNLLMRLFKNKSIHEREQVEGAEDGAMKNQYQTLDNLQASLYHDVYREELGDIQFEWDNVVKAFVRLIFSEVPILRQFVKSEGEGNIFNTIFNAFQRKKLETNINKVQFIEEFHGKFKSVIEENMKNNKRRTIIFIDDLDRCNPKNVIEVLESIKLFLDVEGCIFILGIDMRIVTDSIRIKYEDYISEKPEEVGYNYLEKIIQLSFRLPPLSDDDIKTFIEKELNIPDFYKTTPFIDIIIKGIDNNPRKIKRFFNEIELQRILADSIKGVSETNEQKMIFDALLLEWAIICNNYKDFRKEVENKQWVLFNLHEYMKEKLSVNKDFKITAEKPKDLQDELNQYWTEKNIKLLEIIKDSQNVIKDTPDFDDIKRVIHLSSVTGHETKERSTEEKDLKGANLIESDFIGHDLRDEDLSYSDLSKSDLSKANLMGANLTHANLSEARLIGANLNNAILKDANLTNANLTRAKLLRANLTKAKLIDADLSDAKFNYAKLPYAKLNRARILDTQLKDVDMHQADLSEAYLSGAELYNSRLDGADMTKTEMVKTNIHHCNLSNTKFDEHTDFRSADIDSITIDSLTGSNWEVAKWKSYDLERIKKKFLKNNQS